MSLATVILNKQTKSFYIDKNYNKNHQTTVKLKSLLLRTIKTMTTH